MVIGLGALAVAGGVGLLGGLLGGGGGGANIEIATSKKQVSLQETISNQYTTTFTDARTLSVITNSPGASQDISPRTTVGVTPSIETIPTLIPALGSGAGGGGGQPSSPISDVTGLLLIGGLIVGGVLIFGKKKKK